MSFTLHPQLAKDTVRIGSLPHSELLLMNDANFPWVIVVPRGEYRELFDLGEKYDAVMQEVKAVAQALRAETNAFKMNIAALGNMVPQLHIHIIARFEQDAAWPKPVWGTPALPYTEEAQQALLSRLKHITNL